MCSSFTDGAAAVVLSATARPGAPRIRSSTIRSGNGDIDYHDRLTEAGAAAWDDAGIDPADVDVVELHDATSPEELYALESLGFYKPGDAGPATVAGDTSIGGKGVTVNTSGGLVARGHPLGATGHRPGGRAHRPAPRPGRPPPGRGGPIGGGGQYRWHDRDRGRRADAAFIGIHVLEAG